MQGKKLFTLSPLSHFITSLQHSEMVTEKSFNLTIQHSTIQIITITSRSATREGGSGTNSSSADEHLQK